MRKRQSPQTTRGNETINCLPVYNIRGIDLLTHMLTCTLCASLENESWENARQSSGCLVGLASKFQDTFSYFIDGFYSTILKNRCDSVWWILKSKACQKEMCTKIWNFQAFQFSPGQEPLPVLLIMSPVHLSVWHVSMSLYVYVLLYAAGLASDKFAKLNLILLRTLGVLA